MKGGVYRILTLLLTMAEGIIRILLRLLPFLATILSILILIGMIL